MEEWNWQSASSNKTAVKAKKTKQDKAIEAAKDDNSGRRRYTFAERIEAKWAVFLEYSGIDFVYHNVNEACEPQFKIPSIGMQIYVRSNVNEGTYNQIAKYGRPLIVFGDIRVPQKPDHGGVKVNTYNGHAQLTKHILWYQCPSCAKKGLIRFEDRLLPCCGYERQPDSYEDVYGVFYTGELLSAYNAALRAKLVVNSSGSVTDYYY